MTGQKFVLVLVAICLTLATFGSARSAVSQTLYRNGALGTLLWLSPDHVGARLARSSAVDLELAERLAPTRSEASIALGLAAESRGDLGAARRHLEEALRRDATFDPRWAMINFLARRGETGAVLARAAPAAAMYEGDLTALYDICLRTGANPDQIYRSVVPARPKAQREYLLLMMQRGRQSDALPVALRLADQARPGDRDLLFDFCDQLLADGAGRQVLQLWKALPRAGAAAGRCLDWKRENVDGIVVMEAGETTVRLELSGRQPESARLLRRAAIVEPGRHYRLRARAVAEDEALINAVEWRWNGAAAGRDEASDIVMEATRPISEISLVIRRRPGQRAAEGALEITNIELEPKAAPAGVAQAGSLAVWRPTIFQTPPSLTHIIMK